MEDKIVQKQQRRTSRQVRSNIHFTLIVCLLVGKKQGLVADRPPAASLAGETLPLPLPYPTLPWRISLSIGRATRNCITACSLDPASRGSRFSATRTILSDCTALLWHHTMSDSPNQHHVGHVDAVNLTVSLCLCYTICIALVRLWIRRGAFGVDDLIVLVATVVTLSHTGSSYAALADGLGKPWIDIKASKDLAKLNAVSIVCFFYSWLKDSADLSCRHRSRVSLRSSLLFIFPRSAFLRS